MTRRTWGAVFLFLCVVGFAANVALLAVNLSLTAQHASTPAWVTVGSLGSFGLAVVAGAGAIATGRRASGDS